MSRGSQAIGAGTGASPCSLIVFDGRADPLALLAAAPEGDAILFPLTSDTLVVESLRDGLVGYPPDRRTAGTSVRKVEVAPSAVLIQEAARRCRDPYIRFVAELPDRVRRDGRGLMELFALDDTLSLWWLSLVAEKNTWKSEAQNSLARLEAIVRLARERGATTLVCACADGRLARALPQATKEAGIGCVVVPTSRPGSAKARFMASQRMPMLKHALSAAYLGWRWSRRAGLIRKALAGARAGVAGASPSTGRDGAPTSDVSSGGLPAGSRSLLLLTYFPNFDAPAAAAGVYADAYFSELQQALEARGDALAWRAISVDSGVMSFDEAMRHAASFVGNGVDLAFVEEETTPSDHLWAARRMAAAAWRLRGLRRDIARAHRLRVGPGDDTADGHGHDAWGLPFFPVLADDWCASLCGAVGYLGCLYYRAFARMVARTRAHACVYPCEMHAWERALAAARDTAERAAAIAPGRLLPLLGYQSGTVSPMLLNYFHDPRETAGEGAYPMPRPEIVAVDGEHPRRGLAGSGWGDRLRVVEALRHADLARATPPPAKKDAVLLAFSIDPGEAGTLLGLAQRALGRGCSAELWMRPHPLLKLADVRAAAGLRESEVGFEPTLGPLAEVLSDARVVIVSESSVAIEALAYGCDVVVAARPEFIDMSPLAESECPSVHHVSSSAELAESVAGILATPYDPAERASLARPIIDDFFCLDWARVDAAEAGASAVAAASDEASGRAPMRIPTRFVSAIDRLTQGGP